MTDQRDLAQEMLDLVRQGMPADATPEEVFAEWQRLNLEGIKAGWLAAIPLKGGNILYKHRANCTPDELMSAMTPTQYELMRQR